MSESISPRLCLDASGVMRVGKAHVPLEQIIESYNHGHSVAAVLARFPGLTREEMLAAIDFHLTHGVDATLQTHRDGNWRRWNETLAQETGGDVQPNSPDLGPGSRADA